MDFITEVTLTQPAQGDREESREGPLWLKFLAWAGRHRDTGTGGDCWVGQARIPSGNPGL